MEIISAYGKENEMLELIGEYSRSINEQGEDVAQCLESQGLDEELKDLNAKYGPPYGRMYLAYEGAELAGCAALTRNDEDCCELKRLYLRPQFRGHGIAGALMARLIDDAGRIGYKHMKLDSFDFMRAAIRLYEKCGFYYIGKYNDNPAQRVVYMQLDLGT